MFLTPKDTVRASQLPPTLKKNQAALTSYSFLLWYVIETLFSSYGNTHQNKQSSYIHDKKFIYHSADAEPHNNWDHFSIRKAAENIEAFLKFPLTKRIA